MGPCAPVVTGRMSYPTFRVFARLLETVRRLNPNKIAINYSVDDHTADGLTHGMFLQLGSYLQESPFVDRLVSAGRKAVAD